MPKGNTNAKQNPVVDTNANEDNNDDIPKFTTNDKLDTSRLYFRAQVSDQTAQQIMCFPKYVYNDKLPLTEETFDKKSQNIIVITDPIKMVKGGIPKFDTRFYPEENSMKRAWFYIPKSEDENSKKLFTFIKQIDDYMIEEINTKQNANNVLCALNSKGKRTKLKGITYVPMIGTAKKTDDLVDEDDDDAPKPAKKSGKDNNNGRPVRQFEPWERIKVKLSTLYDEHLGPNDLKEINTQLYLENKEEPEDCKKVTDFEKHFMWNCTAQFALMLNKVWIKKNDDKKCSIGIKCVQICVTEQPERKSGLGISQQMMSKRLFPTSGPLAIMKSAPVKDAKNNDENVDDDDGNNADDNDVNADNDGDGDDNNADNNNADENNDDNNDDGDNNDGEKSEPESDNETPPEPPKRGNKPGKAADLTVKGRKPEASPPKKQGAKKSAR